MNESIIISLVAMTEVGCPARGNHQLIAGDTVEVPLASIDRVYRGIHGGLLVSAGDRRYFLEAPDAGLPFGGLCGGAAQQWVLATRRSPTSTTSRSLRP